MKLANVVTVPTASNGSNPFVIQIGAGEGVPCRFQIKKGQKLSRFKINSDLNNKDLGPFSATLSRSAGGSELGHFSGARDTGSNNPFAPHSDAGGSGAQNFTPDTDYFLTITADDGKAHPNVHVSYENGGL